MKKTVTLRPMPPVMRSGGVEAARALIAAADRRVQQVVDRAVPPAAMASAPIAPARGTMQLVTNYEATPGGIRRTSGAHWRAACVLEAMNARAAHRAEARGVAVLLPFGPGQIAMAGIYRGLVEWRDGAGVKCSSLEAGRGGGGSGLFIDAFIDQGAALSRLHDLIGTGVALRPWGAMDRDNARRAVTARALVDWVVCEGLDLTAVLRRAGWAANGINRKAVRVALCAALDRMQGYRDG
jgi:hypothetical protein